MTEANQCPAGRPFLRTRQSFKGRGRKKGLDFFRACPWDKWWEEFLTARQKNGRLTYVSAYQFAKAKAETDFHLNLIYRAIGPRPRKLGGLHERTRGPGPQRIPYLGDWEQLRAKAYFSDNETVDGMREVAAEKLNALEAGRGAATIVLDLIDDWMNYDGNIDEAFGGTPVVLGGSLAQQAKRAKLFFELKEKTLKGILALIDKYLACHGIAHDGLNDLGALVMAVTNSAGKNAMLSAALPSRDDATRHRIQE